MSKEKMRLTKLHKIKKAIIGGHYPELSNTRIGITLMNSKDDYMRFDYDDEIDPNYYIEVDQVMADAPSKAISGCMAHELSHILIDSNLSTLRWYFDWLMRKKSRTYRIWNERIADILTVRRGCGDALIKYEQWSDKRRKDLSKPREGEHGLTIQEIRALMNGSIAVNKHFLAKTYGFLMNGKSMEKSLLASDE